MRNFVVVLRLENRIFLIYLVLRDVFLFLKKTAYFFSIVLKFCVTFDRMWLKSMQVFPLIRYIM